MFGHGLCLVGPGCSSIGYGAAVELGPLRVNRNGLGLEFNKHAWNKGIFFALLYYYYRIQLFLSIQFHRIGKISI